MDINVWYTGIISRILAEGSEDANRRTGMKVKALPGVTFETDTGEEGLPLLGLRRIAAKNAVAEQMWFLAGRDNVRDFLSARTRIWDGFAEPDGTVTSAYGHRWRHWFDVDQIEEVLKKLRADPSSRHGVVMMWDPRMDLVVPQKNVPCPYTFTVGIIGGRLHLHLVVRSNDMVLGFPTDAAGFGWLLMVLAQELGVEPGKYTHSISNAHVYEDHWAAAGEMARRGEAAVFAPVLFRLPEHSYERAVALDESLFEETVAAIEAAYRPLEAIKGLTVAK